jgi:hypothetical protein
MTIIEIRPNPWAWKVFESTGVEPYEGTETLPHTEWLNDALTAIGIPHEVKTFGEQDRARMSPNFERVKVPSNVQPGLCQGISFRHFRRRYMVEAFGF